MKAVPAPEGFEARLACYLYECLEEYRAVRVGEKETSEQAAIVAHYADLFTHERYVALADSEESEADDERERLLRLREACKGGIIAAALAERSDALENSILACRVRFGGEELSLRAAQARLAVLENCGEREALGHLTLVASARFNDERIELLRAREALEAELSGERDPVARSSDLKQVDLHRLAAVLDEASRRIEDAYADLREQWLDRILGPEREDEPLSVHVPYVRRMSPLPGTYTKARSVPVCLATLEALGFDLAAEKGILLDLDDRPQKHPRACVVASDPPRVVHLITRAQGGLADYRVFLHEAGHALHYAGCDPMLPYAFRYLARDYALTELYAFLVESLTHEPGWHAQHFDLSSAEAKCCAEATRFLGANLFRRHAAKLRFELGFWGDFEHATEHAGEYERLVSEASGFRYPREGYLSDMDEGFYSADYLRASIRAAQVRAYFRSSVGVDWWRRRETGEFLRGLFGQGTRPLTEDVAVRVGFDPLDTEPLVRELSPPAA